MDILLLPSVTADVFLWEDEAICQILLNLNQFLAQQDLTAVMGALCALSENFLLLVHLSAQSVL
jgi:hypothetical protein